MRMNHLYHSLSRSSGRFVLAAGIVVLLAGCGGTASTPTLPPSSPTATAAPSSTPTSLPTSTPTFTATPDQTATAAAVATEEMEHRVAEIAPVLEKLGYDTSSGTLIYYEPAPVKILVNSYQEKKPKLILEEPAKDFILRMDIGWNSTSGLAGCGIAFRAEADLEQGGQYQFSMLRLSGAPAWDLAYFRYNQFQYDLLPEVQFTAAIDERQDAVNTITLIVEGDTIETIINTTKGMDAVDKKQSEGSIALLAWQESGKTVCTFSNIWVWALNTPAASN